MSKMSGSLHTCSEWRTESVVLKPDAYSFVCASTYEEGEFSRGGKSPLQGPKCLARCTHSQKDVLNQWYESQTRTRSYVLAHFPPLFKLALRHVPRMEARQTVHSGIRVVRGIQSNIQTNRTRSYVLDPISSRSKSRSKSSILNSKSNPEVKVQSQSPSPIAG